MSEVVARDVAVDDVAERVVAIVTDILALDSRPALENHLVDDLGADSIDLFSLVSALEDEFGGAIDEEDMDAMQTLSDVVEYIRTAHRSVQ